jgi:trehalose-6-phosphatase
MILRAILLIVSCVALLSAEDAWEKVRALKTGTELRIYKRGATAPVLARSDDVTDENLLVVVKNSQIAISKDEIDRVDARRAGSRRVTTESHSETIDPSTHVERPQQRLGPTTSSGSSVNFGSKPDFDTIYRRTPSAK